MSDNSNNEKVGIMGKVISYGKIFIPVVVIVAIGWGVVKYITNKTNGKNTSVGKTVKESIALAKNALNFFNGK